MINWKVMGCLVTLTMHPNTVLVSNTLSALSHLSSLLQGSDYQCVLQCLLLGGLGCKGEEREICCHSLKLIQRQIEAEIPLEQKI